MAEAVQKLPPGYSVIRLERDALVGAVADLNDIIKQREEFRPFAPAVVAEEAATYFDIADRWLPTFRHMLVTAQVRAEYRSALPAVTHVDGSARVQVVVPE